jgi:hypothetical protein
MQILPRVIALLLSDQIDVSKVAARTIGALVEDLSLIWTYSTNFTLTFEGVLTRRSDHARHCVAIPGYYGSGMLARSYLR